MLLIKQWYVETFKINYKNGKHSRNWRSFIGSNKKYNGIGCFIEDFIEQVHQFGMLDERRKVNTRDRTKTSFYHFKNESISNNGEIELKIEQVRMQTRRKQKKRKPMDEKSKNKIKRQNVRDKYFEQWMENNATKTVY